MGLTVPQFLRNPVFERECLAFCRTKRWFMLRTGLVAGITLAVWLFFAHAGRQITIGNTDIVGRTLFAAACLTQVVFVFFLTPALLSDLVASERRTGNLDILMATPLSHSGVLIGKYLSRVVLILIVVAASFPVITATLLFGGVRSEQVGALFLLSAGEVLLLAGPAILFSTCSRRAATAAVLSYLIALSPLLITLLGAGPSALRSLDWLSTAMDLAFPDRLLATGGSLVSGALTVFLLGLASSVIGLLLAGVRLRYEDTGWSMPLQMKRMSKRRGRVFDTKNPMVPREALLVRGSVARGPFWVVLVLLVGLYATVLFGSGGRADIGTLHAGLATASAFAIMLLSVLAGSTSIIADRERGIMDALRLTHLSPRDVVGGKTMGTFRAIAPLTLLPFTILLLAGPFTLQGLCGAALYALEVMFLSLISAMLGVHHSIQARTVTRAILQSMWQFAVLTVAYPLLMILMSLLMTGRIRMGDFYGFTVLFPVHGSALASVSGDLTPLGSFVQVFYLTCLIVWTPLFYVMYCRRYSPSGGAVASDRAAALSGWENSWGRLVMLWKEE